MAGFGLDGRAQAQTVAQQQRAAAATAAASASDDFAMKAANETKLAYVITGDAETDAISKAGLSGLTIFLAQRTALEAGEPIGLDITRDDLNFFPLIYWPIVPGAAKPSPEALARIDAYMKQGGTVLFDTRDAIMAPPGPGGEARSTRHAGAARNPVLARHSGARAGFERSCADQDLLPAARFSRTLQYRPALGGGAAGAGRSRWRNRDAGGRPAPATASPRF